MTTQQKAEEIAKEFDADGAIIILQKCNDKGQTIAVSGLDHAQTRECLSIATYYNEKIELESHFDFLGY